MSFWTGKSLLEIVEELAEHESQISSEEQLSERFDSMLKESKCGSCGAVHIEDDEVALNEAFSNYTDGLVRDGELHLEQYQNYEYVGEFS